MADFSFRGKPSQKRKNKPFYGLSQSLAVRVLLASLLFLVVPLLFFSIVLYVHDYHDKIRDNDKILQMLSHEKSLYLQKSLEYQMMLLTIIDETTETSQKEFSLKRFNQFLHQHVLKKEVEALFYLISDHNGNAACAASSDLAMVGEDFSFLLDDRDFIKPGFAIYIDERSPYTVYLMKEVKRWGEVTGLIVLELPKNILLDQLHSSASFASTVSLMNKRDKVILSTSPTMEEQILRKEHDKPTVALTPLKNFQGEYRFEFEGTSRIGIKSQIENTNFSLFIDIPEYLSFMEFEGYLTRITSLFIIILLVGGGGTIWITFRIAKPLKRLGKVMQDVGDGDFNSRYKKDWMGFEINALGKVFNEMLESLIVQIDAVRHERVEKETYARELMLGQEMQKSLLPKTLPEFPGVAMASGFIPAKEVGGDFYDLFVKKNHGNQTLMLSMADTAGKGIFACFYSLCVRSMLRSYAKTSDDLGEIVRLTNALFCLDTGDTGIFVTAWVGFLDQDSKELTYTSCGHHPAILKKQDGETIKLTTKGMALGVEPFEHIELKTITLEHGDLLVLYTDGIIDAHNLKRELFGETKLLELVDANADLSAKKLVDELLQEVAMFADGAPQFDDLTLLVLKITLD